MEDINSILNYGYVPNLITGEQKADISDMLEAEMKKRKDMEDFFQLFVENCKKNLHIVFRMSPVGSDFRRRLQMFPSLVNCMAID